MKSMSLSLFIISVLFFSANTYATPVPFDLIGVNDPNLKAHVEFGYDSGTGTISIAVMNTSLFYGSPPDDPRLTGFAFNAPTNVTGISSSTLPVGWTAVFDPNSINTPGQFGFFDIGAITGPNFNGGSPNSGIPRSSTFSFSLVLAGTNLDTLNEMSFLSLFSFDQAGPPLENPQFFILRFQRTGPDGEDSDVAIPNPIPEPATMLLLGSGLIGLAGFARKKFKK